MYKILSVTFLLIFVSGCTTLRENYFIQTKHIKKDLSRVYLFRDDNTGQARSPTVLINNKSSGSLPNKGYIKYLLTPGKYSFDMDWGWISGGIIQHLDIKLESGKTYYIRPWITHSTVHIPAPVLLGYTIHVQFQEGINIVYEKEAFKIIKKLREVNK
ncbi:hypothetical protein [uncultured Gammaproteobacteria bacterium]|jgi:hypothetical protein|nr:hypothetical protein [uncultured Gammaproteobacteria bacterium]CAC9950851.1 hypothetical protein [uncultured Gammaproteobacteria bacterium]CAC9961165.1 hypothetical protein [uncultured Gammaproteobacteria bacterium]CAC9986666.1 hypothetical protein [uncultured Gammaproteobacteria bacterium]